MARLTKEEMNSWRMLTKNPVMKPLLGHIEALEAEIAALKQQVCLGRAAALREAAERLDILGLASAHDEVLALISPEDTSLLGAHDSEECIKGKQISVDEIKTAIRIMLDGKPGAAQNAVREDYPELADMLDAYVQEKVDAAVLAESEWWSKKLARHEHQFGSQDDGPHKECFTRITANRTKVHPQASAHKTEGE